MKQPTPFRDRLTLIALDKAHTIWSYKGFRKEFKEIYQLRIAFPNVHFAAFSATFPPHIVSYVQRILRLKLPTKIITYNGRRTNIDILVAEQPRRKTFKPLLDLIPIKINSVRRGQSSTRIRLSVATIPALTRRQKMQCIDLSQWGTPE